MIIQLISSASKDYFPDNQAGNFRVQLPKPLAFSQDSEVALLRLRYPKTWLNVSPQDCYIHSSLGPVSVTFKISARNYRSALDLVKELNDGVKKSSITLPGGLTPEKSREYEEYFVLWGQLSFEISESGRLRGKCFEGTTIRIPSARLRAILGLETSSLTVGSIADELQSGGEPHMITIDEQFFRNPINVHAGDSAIFVYRYSFGFLGTRLIYPIPILVK